MMKIPQQAYLSFQAIIPKEQLQCASETNIQYYYQTALLYVTCFVVVVVLLFF